ncbi:hypothetical protein M426DRAFT_66299 [Hypoxylon sp. CI-4A]|nr:hypothetical protein M426DRAFT_66299 [Hypoxylon sp. CI-4A]
MQAVKVRGRNDVFIDPAASVPALRPGFLLIKVTSVALNPSDWKRVNIFDGKVPRTVGCDAVGRVVACGENIGWDYKPGDRVAGLCYGMKDDDPTSGAFGEYALLKGMLSLPVPDHISDLEAATVPVGTNFVTQALYYVLKLPLPRLHPKAPDPNAPAVLIYGGATATGIFGLQYARLSGWRVLTTCSPHNFQLVKALGAHEVYDYHDSKACAAAIRTGTGNNLRHVFDCVSEGSSLQICADALTSQSDVAVYIAALPIGDKFPRKDVQHGWTSGYTAFGEMTHLTGKLRPTSMIDPASAAEYWKMTTELLRHDRLRLAPLVHSREGGLAGIPTGLSELRGGRVSAGKLVYRIGH